MILSFSLHAKIIHKTKLINFFFGANSQKKRSTGAFIERENGPDNVIRKMCCIIPIKFLIIEANRVKMSSTKGNGYVIDKKT